MTSRPTWAALALALAGCATQADIDRALSDELRFTGRVVGFALDADLVAIETRLALLRAFEGDPRYESLTRELGTPADLEAKRDRVRESQRSLLEENRKLRERYQPEDER